MPAKQPEYDLIVIGSGPAGQKATPMAANHCSDVAIIEQRQVIGSACLHMGTIPGKTLREAVPCFTDRGLHKERHYAA
jgi:NAD(P) transhydrogenase